MRLRVDARKLQGAANRLAGARQRSISTRRALAQSIASHLEGLALRRMLVDKTDPDGVPWQPWQPSYADTRTAGHSLLIDTRELVESFTTYASPNGAIAQVLNSAPHAGYVQKARPFLGFGFEEEEATQHRANGWLSRLL